MGLFTLKKICNIQLRVPFWPEVELQKLQSTRVTYDLAKHDPLMHDRLGGGSVGPRGGHLNAPGLAEVWDSVHEQMCDSTAELLSVLFGKSNYPQEKYNNLTTGLEPRRQILTFLRRSKLITV